MSLSKFGPRTRSLRQSPWIVNSICSPTRKHKGQTIDVIRHVETTADGSMVREVADGDVIIRAVFSAEAVEKFRKEQEDSDSCPLDWNQALLLVVEYHTEFRPHRNLAQCEFVLHINLFRLWDLQEGFQRKHRLVHCEADARIQKKTKELWEEKQIEWQREEEQKNSKPTTSHLSQHNESVASVTLTQLLEEMAKDDAHKETTNEEMHGEMATQGTQNMMTRQGTKEGTTRLYRQEETSEQDKTKELAGQDKQNDNTRQGRQEKTPSLTTQNETSGNREISNNQDLRRPFIIAELLIPEHERLILEEIAEWKEGYMPPETSVTASSEEVGSSDKIESYVRHTLIDDVSSMETLGRPSPPKKGRKDVTPMERTDTQGENRISNFQEASPGGGAGHGSTQRVGRSATSPEQCHGFTNSTRQNASEASIENLTENDTGHNVVKTVNTILGLTDVQPENIPSQTENSCQNLNDSGPFIMMCDIPESQGFIPCVSPENGSSSDTNRGKVAILDETVTLTQHSKSLEALDVEEEKRLEKLATPSKGFPGCNVTIPERTEQQSTTKQQDRHIGDSDGDRTDDELVAIKHKARVKKIPREETPYSSSQTDSEPDNQVKRRRLTFSVAKLGSSSSSPGSKRKGNVIGKDISCQQSPEMRNQTEDVVQNSPEPQVLEHAVSGLRGSRSQGTVKKRHVTGKTPTDKDSVTEAIIINSSQESISSGDSPSVLKSTKRKRKRDLDDWTCHSLPSYQPPKLSQSESPSLQPQSSLSQNLCFPLSDTTLADKAMLLASLTDLTAPTELGQKLLALKFSDRLVNQMVDFYTHG
ncbi:Adrenocortical dysplasia protein-like [Mizuhopecten yessoensis]|uniref:Adrenocortical dysplasia protein-like n=1 Tax=Mizuhopecten yessoensis TaxID=6573 RepID=A0A210QHP8_MIZYE|nr:Adrenocortical dysplasia protein-like [Mizuhopecten yessoensis]